MLCRCGDAERMWHNPGTAGGFAIGVSRKMAKVWHIMQLRENINQFHI